MRSIRQGRASIAVSHTAINNFNMKWKSSLVSNRRLSFEQVGSRALWDFRALDHISGATQMKVSAPNWVVNNSLDSYRTNTHENDFLNSSRVLLRTFSIPRHSKHDQDIPLISFIDKLFHCKVLLKRKVKQKGRREKLLNESGSIGCFKATGVRGGLIALLFLHYTTI